MSLKPREVRSRGSYRRMQAFASAVGSVHFGLAGSQVVPVQLVSAGALVGCKSPLWVRAAFAPQGLLVLAFGFC